MISDLFLRRSLALLPVDSRAVFAAAKTDAEAVGRLMSHYDFAMATLRAAVGPEDDDDGEVDTEIYEPVGDLVAKGHVS